MTLSLHGRTALVTGVSSGLGAGIARVFAGYGANVVGIARRRMQGLALQEEIAATGGRMIFIAGDITDPAAGQAAADACLAKTGRLDILINNAGVGGAIAAIEDADVDDWNRTLEINLSSVFHLCRLALPIMRRQQDGVVLNVASINAKFGIARMAAYSAAKAGLVHLTKVIAAETVAANIRANAIILGGVRSEMAEATVVALARAATGSTETPAADRLTAYAGMMMAPDDVARSLAALCLPEAALITGSEIAIDRAFSAGAGPSALIYGGAASLLAKGPSA